MTKEERMGTSFSFCTFRLLSELAVLTHRSCRRRVHKYLWSLSPIARCLLERQKRRSRSTFSHLTNTLTHFSLSLFRSVPLWRIISADLDETNYYAIESSRSIRETASERTTRKRSVRHRRRQMVRALEAARRHRDACRQEQSAGPDGLLLSSRSVHHRSSRWRSTSLRCRRRQRLRLHSLRALPGSRSDL